jgi:hypothetical protein
MLDHGDSGADGRRYGYYAPLMIGKGIIGLIAGMVLMFWPKTGLGVVAVVLGIFLLSDGIERIITVLRSSSASMAADLWFLAGAVLRVIFGAVILLNPVASGGIWAVVIFVLAGLNLAGGSLFTIWTSPELRHDPMGFGAVLIMLILGLLMVMLPLITALLMFRVLGVLLILSSVPALAVGLRSRRVS